PADPAASTGVGPTTTVEGAGVVGTPYYMSPEQLRDEKLDGRSDQFAWGVIAYELLCGSGPWTQGSLAVHLIPRVPSMEAESLSLRNPKVPKHVEAIIHRALSKVRGARFGSMEEIAAALGHVDAAFVPLGRTESAQEPAPTQMAAATAALPPPT